MYIQQQLLSILNQPVRGNGLISRAYQEIAATLNIANGAGAACIEQTLTAADALIGDLVIPPVGSGFLRPTALERPARPIQRRQVMYPKPRGVSAANAGCQSTAATDIRAKA
jgi:hypothetical protein